MKFFILLVIYALLWTADCFQSSIPCLNRFSKRYESEVFDVRPETMQPDELPWLSPKFSKEQLELWWDMRDHFMTIGPNFVKESHCNHLGALVHTHGVVRVKTSTDKVNPIAMVKEFLSHPANENVQVLEIRPRGAMFGRMNLKATN